MPNAWQSWKTSWDRSRNGRRGVLALGLRSSRNRDRVCDGISARSEKLGRAPDREYSGVIKEALKVVKREMLIIDIDDPLAPEGEPSASAAAMPRIIHGRRNLNLKNGCREESKRLRQSFIRHRLTCSSKSPFEPITVWPHHSSWMACRKVAISTPVRWGMANRLACGAVWGT